MGIIANRFQNHRTITIAFGDLPTTSILIYSDSDHFPSSPALSPPSSAYTSPLKATTTPKRHIHPEESQDTDTSRRCRPPPAFHNSSVLSLHPEYNNEDTTLKPELRVSARESSRNLRRSFHLTQLQRSSLHLEKRLISQKILEHEISLQALRERMVDVENNIATTTRAVGNLHYYMDQVGVSIPDIPDHVAASIMSSEVGDAVDSRDQTFEDTATSEEDEAVPLPSHLLHAARDSLPSRELESNRYKRPIDYLARSIRDIEMYVQVHPDVPSHVSGLEKRSNGPTQAPPHRLGERAQERACELEYHPRGCQGLLG
ncbi:hypothetical protein H4582DRAFT_2089420 [Lactarius indigo]|nr:hypothetical protein H4582DRAFT_2089420 [Lactarius indigo]